jgi:hypothetical protein
MSRDCPLKLAGEHTGRANAQENDETAVWQAGSGDATMTRTLTDRPAAIGAAINHERQEYA